MSLLGAPRQVSRTFKNIGRIKQISSVFAKHGFQELMAKLGLGRFVPKQYQFSSDENPLTAPERLRQALEELGPTFIKLGQVLSSRSDLLPEPFVRELSKLQDSVTPLPFSVIKESVEKELNASLEDLFFSFSEEPLASASIGQVHEAILNDGKKVVVKVQRPGIDTLIKTDVSVLTGLAMALEKYAPETKVLAPVTCVEEFFQAMSLELDFILEANNILKSRENLKSMPDIYIPQVYLRLCTHKILVIEHLEGLKLDNTVALNERGYDRTALAETTARAFLKTVLEDGFFHGDLHMGNLFALAPSSSGAGNARVGMIDFGIMGYLTPRSRESLLRIFLALSEEDFETLCLEFAELGSSRGKTDFDAFQRNIQTAVAPFLGLPLGSLNVGKILLDATTVAARHQIRIPREWMLIFKAIYTLEGTCRQLNPAFNPMPLLESHLTPLLKPDYNWNQISKELLFGSRDIQYVAHMLPRQLHWFFKRLAANGYALEMKDAGAEQKLAQQERHSLRMSGAVVCGFLLLGSLLSFHLAFLQGEFLLKALGTGLLVGAAWFLKRAW